MLRGRTFANWWGRSASFGRTGAFLGYLKFLQIAIVNKAKQPTLNDGSQQFVIRRALALRQQIAAHTLAHGSLEDITGNQSVYRYQMVVYPNEATRSASSTGGMVVEIDRSSDSRREHKTRDSHLVRESSLSCSLSCSAQRIRELDKLTLKRFFSSMNNFFSIKQSVWWIRIFGDQVRP